MSSFDDDPVKDLFDREREQIVSQRNDLHWQSIVRRARAQRHSRFLGYAAGMTPAGLVIGAVNSRLPTPSMVRPLGRAAPASQPGPEDGAHTPREWHRPIFDRAWEKVTAGQPTSRCLRRQRSPVGQNPPGEP